MSSNPKLARIIEDQCVGCTKCIDACPVDAIVGAEHMMHTVIMDDCIGCMLCVPPCPIDCIETVITENRTHKKTEYFKERSRKRKERMAQKNLQEFLPTNNKDFIADFLSRIQKS